LYISQLIYILSARKQNKQDSQDINLATKALCGKFIYE
jgi:hypothetical protein